MLGRRVLVVDLDPQGNATTGLGIDKTRLSQDVYHALVGDIPLESVLVRTEVDNLRSRRRPSILPARTSSWLQHYRAKRAFVRR